MALQSSGPISFSEIAAEFGDTPPYSLSEYYREAGKVPGNNTNVPTSGAVRLGHFFNAVNEIIYTATSAASLNLSSVFGANWGTTVPKRLIIPSGVVLGPVTIPADMSGTLILQNAGEIQGLGGAANGGAGGNAVTAYSSFTLVNEATGAVRGGGGGGGTGGQGGPGTQTVVASVGYTICRTAAQSACGCTGGTTCLVNSSPYPIICTNPSYPRWQYCYKEGVYNYFTGGAGGAGGQGTGYGQTLTSGSAGAYGGTYAGTGGTGGSGGTWATSGSEGSVGANGNDGTGALGGATGGAAGAAILMLSGSLTVTNNGTINGVY